ncbi:hypothetical protein SAMN05216420_10442 [Nitrosospira sp. Nl5]|nr:hypothetical protein SAMN05216420_10442 [Nitrosospira sp. Nl5]
MRTHIVHFYAQDNVYTEPAQAGFLLPAHLSGYFFVRYSKTRRVRVFLRPPAACGFFYGCLLLRAFSPDPGGFFIGNANDPR